MTMSFAARSCVRGRRPRVAFLVLAGILAAHPLPAQTAQRPAQPAAREPVGPEDYGRFETTGAGRLSPDGRWLAHAVSRVNEQNELRVRLIGRDSMVVVPFGGSPAFSGDSRWLAYSMGVSTSERERLTEAKTPVRNRAELLDLRTGRVAALGEIESYEFSPDGAWLALRGYAPEGRRGSDLIIRDLERATNTNFGNVSSFAWASDGAVLAITLETESGTGNAVQLYDGATGTLRVLDTSTSRYSGLAWREDARDIAVLRALPDTAFRDTAHVVIAWTNVNTPRAVRTELQQSATAGFPAGVTVSAARAPEWSADGSIITVGLRPRVPGTSPLGAAELEPDPAEPAAAAVPAGQDDTPSDVQIWHARDVRIIPQQKAQEEQDLRRTLLAAWHVGENRLVQIGTELQESAHMLADGRHATETDQSRNAFGTMFGRPGSDIWLIDVSSGARERVLEDVPWYLGASETGRYLLWFEDGAYWTYDVRTGARTRISAGIDAMFEDEEYDYPVDAVPPYGFAGWTQGDEAVLVHDRYDVWSIAPDGSGGRRLTDGAAERVVHRVADVQPDDDGFDLTQPLYFSLMGERTKQSGWARMQRNGSVERLLLEDARLLRLTRADSAEVFAFTRERFDDAPDWFVGNATLRNPRQVTELNAFQDEFAWGRAELVDFRSAGGLDLQAALLYPAGHDPTRRYPMIVYTYERLSQTLHHYVVPSERSYYNVNVFTANGYFVLMPDIIYRGRDPGLSALEAVEPAVQTIVERGLVDPGRIGLIGHSWGGYQAAFLPTRTDIFAASVAGAPITNFLSFAGAIHWTPGIAEFSHWETGQARMGVPYWEDMDAYLRNSPAHRVHELRTPMLMMFGDADGTVDWHQGVEFYNFARRAGRDDFVLLVYPGEDHGLRKRENQIDYHRRILQWFGHWLKGDPPARWITEGATWLERRDVLGNDR
jgi:dipeptidyl aminopeptidase/acylaminoacyl peptidase